MAKSLYINRKWNSQGYVTFPSQNPEMDRIPSAATFLIYQPMKATLRLSLAAALLPLLVTSCGMMKIAKDKTASGMSSVADATVGRFMGPKVQVVEVREKDLKKMMTGEERALAYQGKKQRRSFWSLFDGPVDFKEPLLPETSPGEMDTSLLPPIE